MIAKPDGGAVAAEARAEAVVAAAHRDRGADAGRVGLEDDARVVRPVAQDAEVEDHRVRRPVGGQEVERPAEALAGGRGLRDLRRDPGEHLPSPAQGRQVAQQLRSRPVRECQGRQAAPLDEVPRGEGGAQVVARAGRDAQPVEHRGRQGDVAHPDAQPLQAGRPEAVGEQRRGPPRRRRGHPPRPARCRPGAARTRAGGRARAGGRLARGRRRAPVRGGRLMRVATRRATGMVRSGRSTSTRPASSKRRKVSRSRPSWARSMTSANSSTGVMTSR